MEDIIQEKISLDKLFRIINNGEKEIKKTERKKEMGKI